MCTIINHKKDRRQSCTAGGLYISGFGIACGGCGVECQCEEERHTKQFEAEKKKIEEDHETLPHQYSYPTHQIQELKKKYNR